MTKRPMNSKVENIPRVLDGGKLLVFTATGDDKSSSYNVPLLATSSVFLHGSHLQGKPPAMQLRAKRL
ncbi:hypothetical protein K435DRAFT_862110 [Dendrothele bispora CBS 962.96]|uniref:Uncharacterized protein n=1 Tax=Dendrothele bispora (strain CBS 962.96) TaxID=1314807 RepID=A0A4S8LTD2_DENBC|nr:hypothetical protein K435DRAFT_862110 [Dendrothele bispora CBS 962.96]